MRDFIRQCEQEAEEQDRKQREALGAIVDFAAQDVGEKLTAQERKKEVSLLAKRSGISLKRKKIVVDIIRPSRKPTELRHKAPTQNLKNLVKNYHHTHTARTRRPMARATYAATGTFGDDGGSDPDSSDPPAKPITRAIAAREFVTPQAHNYFLFGVKRAVPYEGTANFALEFGMIEQIKNVPPTLQTSGGAELTERPLDGARLLSFFILTQ